MLNYTFYVLWNMALFNITGINNIESCMVLSSKEFLTQSEEAKIHKALIALDKDFLDATGIMEIECSLMQTDSIAACRSRSNK